jgi:molybdopterin-guanine dinucleotide biosynthesis protein MobB
MRTTASTSTPRGKDTFRHREAGAFEVVVASGRRLALMREFEREASLSVHQLIAELYDGVDWVLVEGFKDSDLLKIEVWRAASGQPARYPEDDFIVSRGDRFAGVAARTDRAAGAGFEPTRCHRGLAGRQSSPV